MLVTWHDPGPSAASPRTAPELADGRSNLYAILDVAERFRERVRDALAPLGLAYPAYRILALLDGSDAGMDAAELARRRRSSLTSTVQQLEELAREGSVRLVADLRRGGEIMARLTREGAERALECRRCLEAAREDFADALDVLERAELGRLLGRIAPEHGPRLRSLP